MTTQEILTAAKQCAPALAAVETSKKNMALAAMADRVIRVKSGTIRSVVKNEHVVPVEEIEW